MTHAQSCPLKLANHINVTSTPQALVSITRGPQAADAVEDDQADQADEPADVEEPGGDPLADEDEAEELIHNASSEDGSVTSWAAEPAAPPVAQGRGKGGGKGRGKGGGRG